MFYNRKLKLLTALKFSRLETDRRKKKCLETEFSVTKACGQRKFQSFNVFLEGN